MGVFCWGNRLKLEGENPSLSYAEFKQLTLYQPPTHTFTDTPLTLPSLRKARVVVAGAVQAFLTSAGD